MFKIFFIFNLFLKKQFDENIILFYKNFTPKLLFKAFINLLKNVTNLIFVIHLYLFYLIYFLNYRR